MMKIDLFTPHLRKEGYKYSIHNNIWFIPPPPKKRGVSILILSENWFIHLTSQWKECKYLIHNDNGFIHPPAQKKGV